MELSTPHLTISKIPSTVEYESLNENDSFGPPFVAGAVKMAAIDHIQRYQELVLRRVLPSESLDLSQQPPIPSLESDVEVDRLIRLKIIQGMLLNDINQLLGRISLLEDTLASKRTSTWVSNILLAAGTHVLIGSPFIHRLLARNFYHTPRLICVVGYSIAIYQLFKFDKSTTCTKRVREDLEQLQHSVGIGERLDDRMAQCLEGENWSRVPWQYVEHY